MACNFCLLWHYCRLIATNNKSLRNRSNISNDDSTNSTGSLVPFDSRHTILNEKSRRPIVPRFILDQTRKTSANTSVKELDQPIESMNLNPDLSLNKSRALPLGANPGRARGVSDPLASRPTDSRTSPWWIETDSSSLSSDQDRSKNNVSLRPCQSLSLEHTNLINSRATRRASIYPIRSCPDERLEGLPNISINSLSNSVSVRYVPRPKQ